MPLKAISTTLENYLGRNLDMNLMRIGVQLKGRIGYRHRVGLLGPLVYIYRQGRSSLMTEQFSAHILKAQSRSQVIRY